MMMASGGCRVLPLVVVGWVGYWSLQWVCTGDPDTRTRKAWLAVLLLGWEAEWTVGDSS
jgi:hypothetical protein